jgi:hypothetical protein
MQVVRGNDRKRGQRAALNNEPAVLSQEKVCLSKQEICDEEMKQAISGDQPLMLQKAKANLIIVTSDTETGRTNRNVKHRLKRITRTGSEGANRRKTMINPDNIKPDMPVICSQDGQFASVDHMELTNTIKLKKDKEGQHHYIPIHWVSSIENGKVKIDRSGDQAMLEWSTVSPTY